MELYESKMHGVTRGQLLIPQDNLFRTLDDRPINGQHLVHNAEKSIERRWITSRRPMAA